MVHPDWVSMFNEEELQVLHDPAAQNEGLEHRNDSGSASRTGDTQGNMSNGLLCADLCCNWGLFSSYFCSLPTLLLAIRKTTDHDMT